MAGDFPFRADERDARSRPRPVGIEGVDEFVAVGGNKAAFDGRKFPGCELPSTASAFAQDLSHSRATALNEDGENQDLQPFVFNDFMWFSFLVLD